MKAGFRLFMFVVLAASPLFASIAAKAETIVRGRYLVFSDSADATQYVRRAFPQTAVNLIPLENPLYARAEMILENVWRGYQAHDPRATAGLPRPQVILLEGKHIDAYIAQDPQTQRFPNAVFILNRVMEFSDSEIAGLLGHELTHLLKPDFKPSYYQVSGAKEPLGFSQASDAKVEALVKQWLSITEIVGPFYVPALNGLPAPVVYDGRLFNVSVMLARRLGDPQKPECQRVMDPLPGWRLELVVKYLSVIDQSVRMTSDEEQKLDLATKAYIADMRACLGTQRAPLIPALVELLHEPEESLKTKYKTLAEVFDAEPNVVESVLALARFEYAKLDHFQTENSLTKFRVFSNEEFADDESVRVLKQTQYAPNSLGHFFFGMMEDMQPGTRKVCTAILESGKVPPYGLISDPHHALCYRVYHINQLMKSL